MAANQSALVRGCCIHDNYMLVQQTIKLLHRKRTPSIFLKLDISKAFDSVSWLFLLEVLKHLGFGDSWCNLLSSLLSTASTRILVNGEPGEAIRHHLGLRQGDPLSPMLFILVMDVLNNVSQRLGSSVYYNHLQEETSDSGYLSMLMMSRCLSGQLRKRCILLQTFWRPLGSFGP